ncbi:hypothetical protein SESBI_47870 [Sesbania bispinosa]|nr:hypothetical protein SESBI_47870 [Sesbania bispinosa]
MAKRKASEIASEAASSGPNPNQQVDHGDVPAPLQVIEEGETQGPTQTQQVPTPTQQEAFKRKPKLAGLSLSASGIGTSGSGDAGSGRS